MALLAPTGRRRAALALTLAWLLGGCSHGPKEPDIGDRQPQRIVSLDYCADQYVLRLADRQRILAVSPDAQRDFSYMRKRAAGLPTVRPVAEDVIVLKPDLVVRSYGGGPQAAAMFARAGVPVHGVGWAEDFPAILLTIRSTAKALGAAKEGERVAAEMRRRLKALWPTRTQGHPARRSALYMTPAGVTSGPGSLIHEMLVAAGLDNFQARPGWRTLPLERLAYEQPDLIAAAFFQSLTNHPSGWSPSRHPVAQSQLAERNVVPIKGAWTACGAWFLMDAVESLARAAGAPGRGGVR